jgi:aconitate hydratase
VVLAGKEYGSGSSRDWAAKGPHLQGVVAVIAQSFERIHRSNLVQMGILPLELADGDSAEMYELTGREIFSTHGLPGAIETGFAAGRAILVAAQREDGSAVTIPVRIRIDTPQELRFYRHGGILPFVLRQLRFGEDKLAALVPLTPRRKPALGPRVVEREIEEGSLLSFPASDPPAH